MNKPDLVHQPDDDWQSCPTGIISQNVAKQTVSERRQFLSSAGGVGVFAILAAFGIRTFVDVNTQKPDLMEFAISCREVQNSMDDYILKAIGNEKLIIKIDKHLFEHKCVSCCKIFDQRKSELSV